MLMSAIKCHQFYVNILSNSSIAALKQKIVPFLDISRRLDVQKNICNGRPLKNFLYFARRVELIAPRGQPAP